MTTENTAAIESADTTTEATTAMAPQFKFASAVAYVKSAPKWVLVAVPAAVVALSGYGYMQHRDNASEQFAQAPMVAGPFGQMQHANGPIAPVAYGPGYNDGYYNDYRGYGDGYGRGYGHGRGHGRARGNFSFNMGGDMSGAGNGWGNGYGDGYGHNRYNNGYYY